MDTTSIDKEVRESDSASSKPCVPEAPYGPDPTFDPVLSRFYEVDA